MQLVTKQHRAENRFRVDVDIGEGISKVVKRWHHDVPWFMSLYLLDIINLGRKE